VAVDTSKLETTLIILKPDAIERRLIGRILERIEAKGLQIVGMKMMQLSRESAESQYAEHKGKPFYEPLVRYMSSHPIVPIAVRGKDAVRIVRAMVGATFGSQAAAGTIRGDFAVSNRFNLIHASDSPQSAQRELAIYFRPEEMFAMTPSDLSWVYDTSTDELV
jgi:nucleoside-diphosphate kinase